jgi:hypothetical protein
MTEIELNKITESLDSWIKKVKEILIKREEKKKITESKYFKIKEKLDEPNHFVPAQLFYLIKWYDYPNASEAKCLTLKRDYYKEPIIRIENLSLFNYINFSITGNQFFPTDLIDDYEEISKEEFFKVYKEYLEEIENSLA